MTRIDRQTQGVYIIAPTPFDANGALDLASVDRMVEFYIESGVSAA
jgi:4-hydroxy-tetrahydrodipicolinate synthase